MKKLVLAFVAIAAVSFASCNDKKNAPAANADSTVNDTANVQDSTAANDSTAAQDSTAHM